MGKKLNEYLRRNLIHAKAVGVYYGMKAMLERVEALKRQPKWLIRMLKTEIEKAESVHKEIAAHRNEIKVRLPDKYYA